MGFPNPGSDGFGGLCGHENAEVGGASINGTPYSGRFERGLKRARDSVGGGVVFPGVKGSALGEPEFTPGYPPKDGILHLESKTITKR